MCKNEIYKTRVKQLKALKNQVSELNKSSSGYLNIYHTLGINVDSYINSPIIELFYGSTEKQPHNIFWNQKPVFFIRRHGSYPKASYALLRRTMVTELDNAYIVFADNYLVRHILELHIFGVFDCIKEKGEHPVEFLKRIINTGELPVAGQLVETERQLGFYTCKQPLSSGADIYLSHFFDVSGNYLINGKQISFTEFCEKHNEWLRAGELEHWTKSDVTIGDKGAKVRRINFKLQNEDIAFLKAYNVRLLSPAFIFAFPYSRIFTGNINNTYFTSRSGFFLGEKVEIRRRIFRELYNTVEKNILKELLNKGGVTLEERENLTQKEDQIYIKEIKEAENDLVPPITGDIEYIVVSPRGEKKNFKYMPEAVAYMFSDYCEQHNLTVQEFVNQNSILEDLVFIKLNDKYCQKVKTIEQQPIHYPNGRPAFKKEYIIGDTRCILTTQWRDKKTDDNFNIVKQWAEDKGYTF